MKTIYIDGVAHNVFHVYAKRGYWYEVVVGTGTTPTSAHNVPSYWYDSSFHASCHTGGHKYSHKG